MINKELALLNDISIDDEITFTNPNNDDDIITLTVIGIFEEQDNDDNDNISMFSNSANMIITNVDVIDNIKNIDDELNTTVTPTFILTSYSDATLFSNELYEKGLSEYYTLSTNEKEVSNATSSVANVSSFATTFLILTLIIGAIILFVINQINIRERKYEIGVLRTIGMKKSLLMLQFLLELTIVSVVFLCLGALGGALTAKPVSNMLLKNEISSSTSTKEEMNKNFGQSDEMKSDKFDKIQGVVNVEAYDSIDAVCDIKVIFELIGICLLLVLIGSSSAIISIQKFSPLEILKERS
jgi:putative ABC transport system permease protein